MKVAEIKYKGKNYAFDKFKLIALVRTKDGNYIYHRCLFDSEEEMYKVKEGDIVE